MAKIILRFPPQILSVSHNNNSSALFNIFTSTTTHSVITLKPTLQLLPALCFNCKFSDYHDFYPTATSTTTSAGSVFPLFQKFHPWIFSTSPENVQGHGLIWKPDFIFFIYVLNPTDVHVTVKIKYVPSQ